MFQSGFVVDEGLCWLYHTYQVLVAWCGVGGGGVGVAFVLFFFMVMVFLVVAWGVAFVLYCRGFFWWWQNGSSTHL